MGLDGIDGSVVVEGERVGNFTTFPPGAAGPHGEVVFPCAEGDFHDHLRFAAKAGLRPARELFAFGVDPPDDGFPLGR